MKSEYRFIKCFAKMPYHLILPRHYFPCQLSLVTMTKPWHFRPGELQELNKETFQTNSVTLLESWLAFGSAIKHFADSLWLPFIHNKGEEFLFFRWKLIYTYKVRANRHYADSLQGASQLNHTSQLETGLRCLSGLLCGGCCALKEAVFHD